MTCGSGGTEAAVSAREAAALCAKATPVALKANAPGNTASVVITRRRVKPLDVCMRLSFSDGASSGLHRITGGRERRRRESTLHGKIRLAAQGISSHSHGGKLGLGSADPVAFSTNRAYAPARTRPDVCTW